MVRFASLLTTSAISAVVVAVLITPAIAGERGHGKHGYSAHGYDDGINCYPVTKVYDHHGRPALFGGTQCQDGYGDVWIEPGSRHLIRYLGHKDEHGYRHGAMITTTTMMTEMIPAHQTITCSANRSSLQ